MFDTIWLFLGRFTSLTAAVSALFAWRAWMRSTELLKANRLAAQRRRAPITIRLVATVGGERKNLDLPYRPRRDQLGRGELLGILGLYYGKERFDPDILRPVLEFGVLSRVLDGTCDDSPADELLEIEVNSNSFHHLEQRVASLKIPYEENS